MGDWALPITIIIATGGLLTLDALAKGASTPPFRALR